MAAPVAFVGREGELSRLLAALAGDARLVLVVGDAGVGKTRLAGEGMARTAAVGAVMVRGECLPLAQTLPLLPVAAALGELARVDGGALMEAALAAVPDYVRVEMARLLPGLASDTEPGPGGWEQGWQQGRLFAAVAEFLAAVAAKSGSRLGLVVEDVHWADGATLDVLTFLARGGDRGAVSVVVTCRGDEAPLPGERAALHERTAVALAAAGDPALAAEVAGHWQAAGNPAAELPARVAAAQAAEQVFGYTEAARHWQRAIDLAQAQPAAAAAAGTGLPQMHIRAIDALYVSGDGERAAIVAEEAYRRFADHPDPETGAAVRHRMAFHGGFGAPASGIPLMEEAQRLYEQALPSVEYAKARLDYADALVHSTEGRLGGILPALQRALEVAEAADATALIPRILDRMANNAFMHGQVQEGFTLLERAWALARAADDALTLVWLAVDESDALLKLARFSDAADLARDGLGPARQAGLQASISATVLAFNASEALIALGRTAEAAALIDPLTTGPPDRLHWIMHQARAEIDLLRGDIASATERRQQIDRFAHTGHVEFARESAQRTAELALWAGQPCDALEEVQRVLLLYGDPSFTISCGRLLAAGMRAGAALAEQARARRDEPAAGAARAAADDLASWVDQMAGAPFNDHPFVATIAAERATFDAERTRVAGTSNPEAWSGAAKAWQDLSCPHRAGYAWWRQAGCKPRRWPNGPAC